jgi:hypothetical protein
MRYRLKNNLTNTQWAKSVPTLKEVDPQEGDHRAPISLRTIVLRDNKYPKLPTPTKRFQKRVSLLLRKIKMKCFVFFISMRPLKTN